MVYILLGNGFEEMEAIGPADLLRRAGIDVALVGLEGQTVTGGQGISVVAAHWNRWTWNNWRCWLSQVVWGA